MVTPANPSIALGTTQQFTAIENYTDGSTQDLTSTATWSSSAPAVATISTTGLASAVGLGQTTIQAAFGPFSSSTTLTVSEILLTGNMTIARRSHTATLLNDGKVLIAGGFDNSNDVGFVNVALASAELYDAATGKFLSTGNMTTPRYGHTATLLNNGLVLIVGGLDAVGRVQTSAELYDPVSGAFTATGSMGAGRVFHTATLLNNGAVLLAGGGNIASELYDPTIGAFTPTGSTTTVRSGHTATLLNNGAVLLAGGGNIAAELYDPTTGKFSPTDSMTTPRHIHTATLLNSGMVLIAGGLDIFNQALASAELYDAATGKFSSTGSMTTPRAEHTATLLNNGMVLLVKGIGPSDQVQASAELYDPLSGAFTATVNLNTVRAFLTATRLNNGTVLIAGGINGPSFSLASAESYQPATLTPADLLSIAVTPATLSLTTGATQQFTATGTFSVGPQQQLASVTWSSSNTSVAQITNDVTNPGVALGVAAGTATITATAGTISGSTTTPVLVSIAVTPANPSISLGTTQQFTGTGTYTDGSTRDLTTQARWSSSSAKVATISKAGLVRAARAGRTTIKATVAEMNGESRALPEIAGRQVAFAGNGAPYQAMVVAVPITVSLLIADDREKADHNGQRTHRIGQEVSVPRHLADDEEFSLPLKELLEYGKKLFMANWTEQEGAGRPETKGTGTALSDPSQPLVGARAFNRVSGPDANSCYGCHNMPYGIPGGGGDFVTNVFVLGQRFDFLTFDKSDRLSTKGATDEEGKSVTLQTAANMRATTGLFGAGYLEMLACQMTAELQAIRDSLELGQTKPLVAKGVSFGRLTRKKDGSWDTSQVEGLPRASIVAPTPVNRPSLILRPWHQASNVVSLREFSNTAFNQHHGMQSTERFGVDTDPDEDGVTNELTRADITAVTLFQATMAVPGRVIPNDPEIEQGVLNGEEIFTRIGCSSCHVSKLPLDNSGWIYSEPNPYNPPLNLRPGTTKTIKVDLNSKDLPMPRLAPDPVQPDTVWVPAYTDFKLHDICDPNEAGEPLDQNQTPWTPKFRQGNRRFLTKRLWGAANEPPFFHHGLFTTLRRAVLAHSGEALQSRKQFEHLKEYDQDSLIEFLKTLQVLPPGTPYLVVDENFREKRWPPPSRLNPTIHTAPAAP